MMAGARRFSGFSTKVDALIEPTRLSMAELGGSNSPTGTSAANWDGSGLIRLKKLALFCQNPNSISHIFYVFYLRSMPKPRSSVYPLWRQLLCRAASSSRIANLRRESARRS